MTDPTTPSAPTPPSGPQSSGPQSSGPPAPTPSDLHRWVVAAMDHFGVDPDAVDVDLLLDLARDVAHTVARPAVPLTTFLAGYAVARGSGDRAALEQVVRDVEQMVARWPDVGAPHGPGATGAREAGGSDGADEGAPSGRGGTAEDVGWSGEGTA